MRARGTAYASRGPVVGRQIGLRLGWVLKREMRCKETLLRLTFRKDARTQGAEE